LFESSTSPAPKSVVNFDNEETVQEAPKVQIVSPAKEIVKETIPEKKVALPTPKQSPKKPVATPKITPKKPEEPKAEEPMIEEPTIIEPEPEPQDEPLKEMKQKIKKNVPSTSTENGNGSYIATKASGGKFAEVKSSWLDVFDKSQSQGFSLFGDTAEAPSFAMEIEPEVKPKKEVVKMFPFSVPGTDEWK
jgi:hypothetical protein